ncbi:hypothetical protein MVEN_01234500 [Mycena venus]|uniref:Uncharacterized protein n=1 Tax=Mycena venus TaxID=2733690 RepID=A0A8H6Y6A3_9AGAR|nr:hypothetical protein MVEN_01234500 [Mycena venus]
MGPHKKDRQLEAIIAEKDAQIDQLRISLEAQVTHSVATNSRLAVALDTLDYLQTQHAAELAAEVKAKERLRDTLTRYVDTVKVAEIERDNLRDAVIELAEKVELSKDDFTSWSHSRIRIPRLLEPLQTMPNALSSIASEGDLWAYTSGMIKFLRSSLVSERRAHTETRNAARARIAVLEAQLARRDSELEECIMHAGKTFPRASSSRMSFTNIPDLPPSPPPIPASAANAAHQRTLAQNVVLEEEVEQLAALLEKARLEATRRAVPPSDTRQAVYESEPDAVPPPPVRSSDSRGRKKRDRQNSHPSDEGRRSGFHLRSSSPARQLRSASHGVEAVDPDQTIRPAVRAATEDVHASLEREIAALGAKIDGFRAEKQILLAQNARFETGSPRRRFRRCHLLQNLEVLAAPAQPPEGPVQARLLEDHDGEMSMDLATPLVPTVMLPVAGPSTLPQSSNFHFVTSSPGPGPPPVLTEMSPLDLSTDRPLPGSPQTWGAVDTPGEQAVQELMGIARRRGS